MSNTRKDLNEGDRVSGYKLLRKRNIDLIKGVFFEFEHERTGAKHIHIKSDDSENVFGVAFKTVPHDSTGIAHILEHTALCGSKNYKVRDPFFSMLKRSLNTFMNAFTASDWTMYPFATENEKDFYNLLGVYLDGAFFPNLDELSFMQEGHRLSADEQGNLSYQGVVYNEMKGAMSSQSQVMGRYLFNALYPDTTYGFNSGGEPSQIPNLTRDDLVKFHKNHYHPSNSWFFTYGNMDVVKHLEFIDKNVLSHFDKIDPGTDVKNQPRWFEPVKAEYTYPADGEKNIEKKSQAAVAWLASDITDSFDSLVLSLLDQILIGNSAAPLYRALIESGLGSSLSDVTGYDGDNKDTLFAAGLKDINSEDAEKVEKIVLDVFKDLYENGIEKELIETAIHQLEFHRREITNTGMPYGLKMFLSISSTWLHGGDPLDVILFDKDLEIIRKKALEGRFFEEYIKKYFLDNKHRVLMLLNPDPQKGQKAAQEEQEKLDEIKKGLTGSDIEKIRQREKDLVQLQEKKEDLSCLPTLRISDITSDIKTQTPDKISDDKTVYYYDRPTSEIFYFSAVFGTGHVSDELMRFLPVFTFLVTKTGTSRTSYIDFTRKIDAVTGGLSLSPMVRTAVFDDHKTLSSVILSAKCLERYQEDMFSLLTELTSDYSFEDSERITSLLMQFRAGFESSVIQNGHRLAISLASRNLSKSSEISELWGGISQLKFIKELTENLSDESTKEKTLNYIKEKMYEIGDLLFSKNNLKICMVGGENNLKKGDKLLPDFYNALEDKDRNGFIFHKNDSLNFEPVQEAWTTQSSVSFVGGACDVPPFGSGEAPLFSVLARLLKSNFLHREIREKGGAYGGFSLYNSEEGIFSCGSYRDPNIKRTIDVFENGADYLKNGEFDDEEIKEAVLQAASDIDRPDTPAVAAKKDFFRRILNIPDLERKKFKEQLLQSDREKLVNVAQKYFPTGALKKNIAVITGKMVLEQEKDVLKDTLKEEEI
jgi:Zn-dependent M16 (insulinase) family peptidase